MSGTRRIAKIRDAWSVLREVVELEALNGL